MEYIASCHLHAHLQSRQSGASTHTDETQLIVRHRHRRRTSFGRLAKSLLMRSKGIFLPSVSPEKWDKKVVDDLTNSLNLCAALSHTLDEQIARRSSRLWAEPRVRTSSVAFIDKPLPQRPELSQQAQTKRSALSEQPHDSKVSLCLVSDAKRASVNIAQLLDKNTEAISWDQGWRSFIAQFPFPPCSPGLPDSDEDTALEPSRNSSILDFGDSTFDTGFTSQDTATHSHPSAGGMADLISACGLTTPKIPPCSLPDLNEAHKLAREASTARNRSTKSGWFYYPAL